MDIEAARTLALDIMAEHGLTERGWQFDFDKATVRFGACKHRLRTITLSAKLVLANSPERVRLTILHEVAHALTPGHHHDAVWRQTCIRIGGDGRAKYSASDTEAAPAPLRLDCPRCDFSHPRQRRTHSLFFCPKCRVELVWVDTTTNTRAPEMMAPWYLVCDRCNFKHPRQRRTHTSFLCPDCRAVLRWQPGAVLAA